MYKTKEIEDLSIRLEAGEISPSICLTLLNRINRERLELKERAEAILTEQYILEANKRKNANWDKNRAEILQMWRDTNPLTNEKLRENLKYTKAYEKGLITDEKLSKLNIHAAPQFTDLLKQFEQLLR
jgi:hypothetical protein